MKKLALAAAMFALSATAASAADLAARPYTKAPVIAPVYNWTGFYVGLNAGGAWNESNATTTTVFSPVGYFAASSVPAMLVPMMAALIDPFARSSAAGSPPASR